MTTENITAVRPEKKPFWSPIMRRRFQVIRNNKRVWFACWFMLIICIISAGANFIANDKPLFVEYKGHAYFPVIFNYPETDFGGFLPTDTDYADPAVKQEIYAHGWWIQPLIPYAYNTVDISNPNAVPSAPSGRHWLGTDDQGRDVLALIIYGIRISLLFAFVVTAGTLVLGVLLGGIQGYYGGWIDLVGQRLSEIWSSLPTLFIIMILSSFVNPNLWWLIVIMLLFSWLQVVDLVRAEFLRTRNLEYVAAAKLLGLSSWTIMWRHVLPNAMVSTLTYLPIIFTGCITSLVSLDYLGFGLPPGSASLGELITQAQNNPHATWLTITAFLTLAILLSVCIGIGQGIRDAMDPRHNSSR